LGLSSRADWKGGKVRNKAKSIICKVAAGHMFSQLNKSLPNYIWYYRERHKHVQHCWSLCCSNLYVPASPHPLVSAVSFKWLKVIVTKDGKATKVVSFWGGVTHLTVTGFPVCWS
jgi:hypothetical protein